MQANLPDQIVLQGEIFSLSHSEVKKGTFHAKMSSIKDRNGMDLTEAEGIKNSLEGIHRRIVQKRSSQPR